MKNNLEKILKEKLANYEAPYDPSAWTKLSAKLTGRSSGSSSSLKWVAASIGIATIAVGSYYLTSSSENKIQLAQKQEVQIPELTTEDIQEIQPISNKEQTASLSPSEENISSTSANQLVDTEPKLSSSEPKTADKTSETKYRLIECIVDESNEVAVSSNPTQTPVEVIQPTNSKHFIPGRISHQTICEGEAVHIENIGHENELVRVMIDGEIVELKKGKSLTIEPSSESVIQYLNENNEIITSESLNVLQAPKTDFSHTANIFDKGLPVVELNAYGSFKSFQWLVNNEPSSAQKSSAKVNLFQKGDYAITLIATDYNGCTTKHEKQVTIENDYNLLAVSAFRPNGSDYRNRTFIPFALTQRNTPFNMVIIDPRDHGIVYSTKDANSPWDGIDQRTGKMTPSESMYIWKVQLEEPLPNEKPLYVGTIIHN